uniref:RNase H type-1 domain-containing protein n=1 Tax=Cannabis sativa TaxID=3483 RepID=A0A803QGA4_CANSA
MGVTNIREYQDAQHLSSASPLPKTPSSPELDQLLHENTHTLFVDAALNPEEAATGLGLVFTQGLSHVHKSAKIYKSGAPTPIFAEAQALYEGLQWCMTSQLNPRFIFSDCLNLVSKDYSKAQTNAHQNASITAGPSYCKLYFQLYLILSHGLLMAVALKRLQSKVGSDLALFDVDLLEQTVAKRKAEEELEAVKKKAEEDLAVANVCTREDLSNSFLIALHTLWKRDPNVLKILGEEEKNFLPLIHDLDRKNLPNDEEAEDSESEIDLPTEVLSSRLTQTDSTTGLAVPKFCVS